MPRVNAEAGNAHVSLLDVSAIPMYAETAGSGIEHQTHDSDF